MVSRVTKVGAIVAAALVVGGLGACSADTGSDDSGPKTITWSFWDQGEAGNKVWKARAAAVTEENPDITVELTTSPFADYFTKLQSQLAAGTEACIVSMQSLRLPAFASALEPLDDLLAEQGFDESEWNEGALSALQFEGEQYAVPYGLSTMLLYYNKDAFAAAGVEEPTSAWTIEDFEAAAEKITAATGKPAFGQSFSDLHMFAMLLADNGAKPVTAEGELDLTSDEMKEAFDWYSGLATEQGVASVPASASDIPWGEQQFVAGNVAMAVDGSWNLASNAADAGFPVGVVALPQGPNGGGTYSANSGFGISKSCENKAAAAEAIVAITGADAAEESAKGGTAPARLGSEDTFYQGLADSIDAKNPGYSQQARDAVEASSEMATPFISTDNWDQVTKQIARQFILAYTGSEDPEQVLEAVQSAAAK
ncbi:ABC transporter substrate-binding protein [Agromyces sp. NPDC058484]|uniref:ABC transporter substrate-binding protein n=1 Tax=Agromyces sp. NPDC058484 TaxID=3346524 RepID=UPI003661EF52